MEDDDIFARPPRRSIPPPAPKTCAVCGLRSHGLVCAMCLEHKAESITWLEKLPSRSAGEQRALDELRDKPPLTFSNAAVIEYWQHEILLGCAASLERLREICAERGADYDRTIAGLQKGG